MATAFQAVFAEKEYDVREFNLNFSLVDHLIKYLHTRVNIYKWVIFLHDDHHDCNIYDADLSNPGRYYHVIVWFRVRARDGSKQYFSNIPLMQWLRRLYRNNGILMYPSVFNMFDIEVRLDRLITSNHAYLNNVSNPHEEVVGLLAKYNLL